MAKFVETAIGVAKEIYDDRHMPEQTPEVWDALTTPAGALPVALFYWVTIQ